MKQTRELSVTTTALLIVVAVFGFSNVPDNLAAIGQSAIPSWIAVGLLYFVPLSLILAEFSSALPDRRGGIYSYMELGLGPTWAFVGTWAYFVANLVFLQTMCSRVVINLSLAITGRDVFDDRTWMVPPLGVVCCLALTFVSTRGVRTLARIVGVAGKAVLTVIFGLIAIAIGSVFLGLHVPATPLQAEAMVPSFDLVYLSTFAWLLYSVAGAEAAGPYVNDIDDPSRNFPRAILLASLLVGTLYVMGTVAVCYLVPIESLNKATAVFASWHALAALLGLPAAPVARAFMTLMVGISLVGCIIWMGTSIRAMFADVPKGTFPDFLTRSDAQGTHHAALWTQAAVVSLLILVPLLSIGAGVKGSDRFISLLNDMTSLAVVVPYLFVSIAYVRARRNGMDAPFKVARSTAMATAIGGLTFVISALGYGGAGLYALQAETIDWVYVATVYLGPALLILLGLWLRRLSMHQASRAELGA